MENILELKTVNELQEYKFYVPSYQRGYRWSSTEVTELLNDISEFNPRLVEATDDKTWYCLQPIVVKEKHDRTFEVIDGQQRLTTIYLILFYLNQDYKEDRRDKLFDLDYETRHGSKDFLKDLENIKDEEKCIDFHFIANAYKTINEWFNNKGINFDKNNFKSNFKFHSKVIWYLSNEDDSIAIFTRINIGKIPLTNSELIKALFLNSSNFDKTDDKLRLRQLEISTEWDFFEHSLQNQKFWYFLNQNNSTTNRIEFIFRLMNDNNEENDNYSTFRFFSKKFASKKQIDLDENWNEVKRYFQTFNEWFHERELYHKIGYLVSIEDVNLKELYLISDKITKTEFKLHLDNLIRNSLKNIDLNKLQYSDGKNVRKILLLYNILTMLTSDKDNSFFPFDLYKNEKWDIEHITSIKDKIPDNKLEWLSDAKPYIDTNKSDGKNLLKRIDKCDCKDDLEFKSLFEDIVTHFNSELNDDDDINDISNLTLLDRETNRGYKNAVFPFKRNTIINRDKQGIFIPICTKNVFLKYFSEYPPKISFWTQQDRESYEKDLFSVLEEFLIK
ncbi:DUF262 domain-containing protein [Flavobacterium ginsengisoli]|uniref:DUF262 domain-containing protein n=1 Tax=Flavobacterium ginsengisoli TaxID=871694 RepID=A0ABP7ETX9_9FLAO|nr:DUF262 domain-containing protein [Flavobacterium ginsengisoli]